MKNKKGFTLIELLAVIIILGILMIIAIPSVTKYISDSRKSSYVDTAKEIIAGARNAVNEGKLGMYDTNTTYYIASDYIKTENASKSPYGDFVEAYVVVTYDGKGYSYYWISVDDAGQGVKEIVSYDKLDTDNIESDIDPDTIDPSKTKIGIGNRTEIKVLDKDGNWVHEIHLDDISNNVPEERSSGDSSSNAVVYPTGKTKDTVVAGDIVTIDTEEFYVVKHDGSDLVLLSHYNLNVGSNKKSTATEGIQDSEVKGFIQDGILYGNIRFSDNYYWYNNTSSYAGSSCESNTYVAGTNCKYVYDSNSNLYQYVESYKTYLEGKGITIKNARLLRVEEAFELGCGNGIYSCKDSPANAPSWIYETSYFLGTSNYLNQGVWYIKSNGNFNGENYSFSGFYGVRPVIVI